MPVTQPYTGTESISTTEWSMTTDTAGPDVSVVAGVYQAVIDLNALVNGDSFEFRVYEKVLAASTQRCAFVITFDDAQVTDVVYVSPPFALLNGWDMTLKRLAGANRSIDWSIRKAT